MIGAVVLAAGASRRMGEQKLLLPFGKGTVIEHIVDRVRASRVDRVAVVTGHDRERVEAALAGRGVTFAHNARYTEGMLTSVRCGLAALPIETTAYVVVLGDQPGVTPTIIDALIGAFEKTKRGIVVPTYGNVSGHPVLIAATYRDAVMARFDSIGLRGLIRAESDAVHRVPMPDDDVLRDMDTPEDYQNELLKARRATRNREGAKT